MDTVISDELTSNNSHASQVNQANQDSQNTSQSSGQNSLELSKDNAWASFNCSLSVEALKQFCNDVERLFRINPMLEFKQWQSFSDDHVRLHCINTSQKQAFEVDVELTIQKNTDGFEIVYSTGIKNKTVFKIESIPEGSRLTITDYYNELSDSESPDKVNPELLNQVDKSIVIWANYLQRYISMWQRWSRFALWRWYMRKVWQPMKPSGRRITYMLLWITAFEIALISLGFAIYYIEFAT